MSEPHNVKPVLILGAGINGCAAARELVLNGVPVTLVDTADIAQGATAKSSRLIHGGVRYLEYADFDLVAESLEERERQLTLAPQFVRSLRLHIPVRRRLGGLVQGAFRFLGLTRFSVGREMSSSLSLWSERGLFAVRFGLWLYDRMARSSLLPEHTVRRITGGQIPLVDASQYHWVISYSDAQMLYPERFVLALLKDVEQHAADYGVPFRVLPYHRADFSGRTVRIRQLSRIGEPTDSPAHEFEPSVIINATGAWGDFTLEQIGVKSPRLFGGTKGSHIITRHAGLRAAIGDDGIYAESRDGRLVFILPFAAAVLVGTTDLRFEESPDAAIATPEEVQYLVDMVNEVCADVSLTLGDVDAHYCGVRPLPYVPRGKTGSIPRGHSIHETSHEGIPLLTLIGGKLTTWRPFGEEVADHVLKSLDLRRSTSTADRPIPGAANFPADAAAWCQQMAAETGHSPEAAAFLLPLMGTAAEALLRSASPESPNLPGLPVSSPVVCEMIRVEHVERLEDLVERRLALIFTAQPTSQTLCGLADCLVETGKLRAEDRDAEVTHAQASLTKRYGLRWESSDLQKEFV